MRKLIDVNLKDTILCECNRVFLRSGVRVFILVILSTTHKIKILSGYYTIGSLCYRLVTPTVLSSCLNACLTMVFRGCSCSGKKPQYCPNRKYLWIKRRFLSCRLYKNQTCFPLKNAISGVRPGMVE